ncbi:MAG: TlyA family RNA methyltransferase [Thermodesulfovibrionales bacterium]|nr:TlyA family RNA methyltransferase [Thermodesulfovibrionales bacterium]
MPKWRKRLDVYLVERGLIESRQKAKSLINSGKVFVNGFPALKAGTLISENAHIELKTLETSYVSRGGYKLEFAIEHFNINVKGKIAMDVGASTGGFTDCLLKYGALKIYCIDVGYGQLAWRLRQDPRVVVIEKTNIRYLKREKIPNDIDIATIDVSFISLTKVVPKVVEFLRQDSEIIALIKPQFEVGKTEVEKGGLVKSEEKRLRAIHFVRKSLENLPLQFQGVVESPIKGSKGNIEYLIYYKLIYHS